MVLGGGCDNVVGDGVVVVVVRVVVIVHVDGVDDCGYGGVEQMD